MRHLTWSVLAAGIFLASNSTSRAQDTVRLGGLTAQGADYGGADLALVRGGGGGHGGGGGGGHGGFGGGGRGGFGGGRGGFGGYGYGRGYGGYGYGRGYGFGYGFGYGLGYGLGYGYGYGYGSYPYYGYGSGYYPAPVYYYSQPTYYYSSPINYYPIAGNTAPALTVQSRSSRSEQLRPPGTFAPMPPVNDGTFPYDGGPRSPVPMPAPVDEFNPANQQRGNVPIDGKLALMPTETTMGSYLLTSLAMQSQRNQAAAPAPRAGYAAYGEDPVTAPVRKR